MLMTVMDFWKVQVSMYQRLMNVLMCVGALPYHSHQSGGTPGTLRLLEPTLPDLSQLDPHALRDYFADTHYATPLRAPALLKHLGRLPRWIVPATQTIRQGRRWTALLADEW